MSEGVFFGFIIGLFIGVFFMGFLLLVITYPSIGEISAEFVCDSHGLVVRDFEQDYGDLVFVECKESPVVAKSGFYWEREKE